MITFINTHIFYRSAQEQFNRMTLIESEQDGTMKKWYIKKEFLLLFYILIYIMKSIDSCMCILMSPLFYRPKNEQQAERSLTKEVFILFILKLTFLLILLYY